MSAASNKPIPYSDNRMLSLRITPETHKALRFIAATDDKSVSCIVKAAIEMHIKNKALS